LRRKLFIQVFTQQHEKKKQVIELKRRENYRSERNKNIRTNYTELKTKIRTKSKVRLKTQD